VLTLTGSATSISALSAFSPSGRWVLFGRRSWVPIGRRLTHYGALHLYGHSHGSLPGCGRSLDVGVDCWDWRPATVPEILERMAEDARREGGPAAAAALAEAA
jgi:hypothetical protein